MEKLKGENEALQAASSRIYTSASHPPKNWALPFPPKCKVSRNAACVWNQNSLCFPPCCLSEALASNISQMVWAEWVTDQSSRIQEGGILRLVPRLIHSSPGNAWTHQYVLGEADNIKYICKQHSLCPGGALKHINCGNKLWNAFALVSTSKHWAPLLLGWANSTFKTKYFQQER